MKPPTKPASSPITPDQLRKARAIIGWSPERLAAYSGATPYGIMKYEKFGRVALKRGQTPDFDALASIRDALEAAGVEFTSGGQLGVKMAKGND